MYNTSIVFAEGSAQLMIVQVQSSQSDVNMEVEEDRSVRRSPNISGLNVTIRNFWSMPQMTVVSARNCLRILMRNRPTVFCILWSWIHTLLDILPQDFRICR